MEADFNASNKLLYGDRMLDNARQCKLVPDDIFSKNNISYDDGGLAKALFYDLVRHMRVPGGIASVDARNCYESAAHAIASLIFQSFGVQDLSIKSMLEVIEQMI